MKTTNMIFEIVSTGLFAMIWLIQSIYMIDISLFEILVDVYNSLHYSILIIILLVVANHLGWIVSWVSFLVLNTYGKKVKKRLFLGRDYEKIRAYVYQFGSQEFRNDIGLDRTIIRFSRGGFFNFLIISILTALSGEKLLYVFFFISISVIHFLQWKKRHKRYYSRILQTYDTIFQKDS